MGMKKRINRPARMKALDRAFLKVKNNPKGWHLELTPIELETLRAWIIVTRDRDFVTALCGG